MNSRKNIGGSAKDAIWGNLGRGRRTSTGPSIRSEVRSNIWGAWNLIWKHDQTDTWNIVVNNVAVHVWSFVWSSVWNNIWAHLQDILRGRRR